MKHWIDEIETIDNNGILYWVRKGNEIDRQVFDETVLDDVYRLESLRGKGIEYAIDLGGNIGMTAQRIIETLLVPCVSVEPMLGNFNLLNKVARHNERAIPVLGAFSPKGDKNFLTTDHHVAANRLAEEGTPVLGFSAEDILLKLAGGNNNTFFLKMDIEGMEPEALNAFLPLLGGTYIAGEWHYDSQPVLDVLKKYGCKNIEILPDRLGGKDTGMFFATKGI